MSSLDAEFRRRMAAHRRQERDEKRRQKELERLLMERAKLSALEQARLEVEANENALAVLLTVHKEQSTPMDWHGFAYALPPAKPLLLARHELEALSKRAVAEAFQSGGEWIQEIEAARLLDQNENNAALIEYQNKLADWEWLSSLSRRVLAGEVQAYTQAVSECPNLAEISNLGVAIHMTVHNQKFIESVLKVKGREVIPPEVKTVTAAGKLANKPLSRARINEYYQDYVCGCILRLAREMFALLPIDTVLLTAVAAGIDTRTGNIAEIPILSLVAPRTVIEQLNFQNLDPADALENFQHRGSVTTARNSDAFVQIVPLTLGEVWRTASGATDITEIMTHIRNIRVKLGESLRPGTREIPEVVESEKSNI